MNVLYQRRLRYKGLTLDIELTREVTGYGLFEQRTYNEPNGSVVDEVSGVTKKRGPRELKQWFTVHGIGDRERAIEAAVDHVRRLERAFNLANGVK